MATLATKGRARDSVHSVTEELSGVRAGDRLLLDGVSAEITPAADDADFMLDSFDVAISGEGTELKGRHSCRLGQGEAVFRRADADRTLPPGAVARDCWECCHEA